MATISKQEKYNLLSSTLYKLRILGAKLDILKEYIDDKNRFEKDFDCFLEEISSMKIMLATVMREYDEEAYGSDAAKSLYDSRVG